jgi:hypothetical protein
LRRRPRPKLVCGARRRRRRRRRRNLISDLRWNVKIRLQPYNKTN